MPLLRGVASGLLEQGWDVVTVSSGRVHHTSSSSFAFSLGQTTLPMAVTPCVKRVNLPPQCFLDSYIFAQERTRVLPHHDHTGMGSTVALTTKTKKIGDRFGPKKIGDRLGPEKKEG